MFTNFEQDEKVNTLVQGTRAVLEQHGISLTITTPERGPEHRPDLVARLDAGSRGSQTYAVELKPQITSTHARALPPSRQPMLLLAPYVSRESAEVLRENRVDFVDIAGNMSISWPSMLITIVGNRPPKPARTASARRARRALSPTGAKVLFALLSWPDTLGYPLRMIADRAGASLGTTQIVMNELEAGGYLYAVDGQRRLTNGRELLDRWAEAFTTSVSHKLALGEFRDPADRWWQESGGLLVDNKVQLGGEAGGYLLDPDLIPTTATLYCDSIPGPVATERRWRRDESEPNVIIRRRFWTPPDPSERCVPSTLIYADMWASGDPRQRAHAGRIRAHDNRLVELDRS